MDDELNLQEQVLRFFPARTHALTVVRDPDGLLADEAALAALGERGFGIVAEADPVTLRQRVEEARPWTPERPLVVVTAGVLNALPYDLWQQGHKIELALHEFFPHQDYPAVRALGPAARDRLAQAPRPPRPLGPRATALFVLRHAFGAELDELREPAGLVAWLMDYHRLGELMPAAIARELLATLRPLLVYAGWDLGALVGDGEAFTRFVREQWRGYVGAQTGRQLNEAPVPYLLGFGDDPALQDELPRLLRTGVLEPVPVEAPGRLPGWTRTAVVAPDEDRRPRRVDELCALLAGELATGLGEARWPAWQVIARAWAELQTRQDAADLRLEPGQEAAGGRIEGELDEACAGWLRRTYAVLAGKKLPTPHHVFHVPDYVAYRRRQGRGDRIALLVLDGLALRDWLLIGEAWRARHVDWRFEESLLLAQVPTITAISRQALIGGVRPAEFAETIRHNRAEGQRWAAFWARQDEPLPADACAYVRLGGDEAVVDGFGPRVRVACLVEGSIDEIVHGASLGAADVEASVRLWLDEVSPGVERMIADLFVQGYTVYLGSDHGHVEARGIGQPMEGVVVETRGRRARTYRDRGLADRVREQFPATELWGRDGLLPDDLWTVMPRGRDAFATRGERVVTHGGPTIDEMVVPFVTIAAR